MNNLKDSAKEMKKKVLVGMSGGIDSTASCLMLQEQGYEVVGATLRMWDIPSHFSTPDQPYPNEIMEAREVAARLGIEHHVIDGREEFKKLIVKYFMDEYLHARTPNPCVMCNPLFKEKLLCECADRTGCDYVVTGHYCRFEDRGEKRYILTGDDCGKDQSYFLWKLPQSILKRMMFPLGQLTKTEVRAYLAEKNFEMKARGGESMEICFIDKDYREFLREQMPDLDERIGTGSFVDKEGRVLGKHKGFPYYTIGQRKGLEIALGKPAFVLNIDSETNTVTLGEREDLLKRSMLVEDFNVVDMEELFSCTNLTVRIRYRSQPVACQVSMNSDGRLLVEFAEPASAVTPGQSAVFYDGNRVLGGGFISK